MGRRNRIVAGCRLPAAHRPKRGRTYAGIPLATSGILRFAASIALWSAYTTTPRAAAFSRPIQRRTGKDRHGQPDGTAVPSPATSPRGWSSNGPLAVFLNSGQPPEEWIPLVGSPRWSKFAAQITLGRQRCPHLILPQSCQLTGYTLMVCGADYTKE